MVAKPFRSPPTLIAAKIFFNVRVAPRRLTYCIKIMCERAGCINETPNALDPVVQGMRMWGATEQQRGVGA
jgi:hypothetical protein